MNSQLSTWEMVALGAIAIAVVFLFRPGIRTALKQSREAKKDWPAVLLPLVVVVVFVIVLIKLV